MWRIISPCVGASPLAAFTSIGGTVTVLGVLGGDIPSPLRLFPKLQTSSCIFVRRSTFPWRQSRGIVPPWSPSTSIICRSCLTALSSEISSAPLRSSVPVVQWALLHGTLSRFSHTFVAPPLSCCLPSLCTW